MSLRVAVVVATYNRPAALAWTLLGLLDQTVAADQVLVADDGSREDTRALVDAFAPSFDGRLKHVWHSDRGFRLSEIRNRAVDVSDCDYLLFLDGDCVPMPDFVEKHRWLARPGCFVTGSRVLLGQALTEQWCEQTHDPHQALGLRRPVSLIYWVRALVTKQCNKLPLIRWPSMIGRSIHGFRRKGIKGCNLAAWRSDVIAVNGFDQSFTGWGHEDEDFVLRLHHLGLHRTLGFAATEVLHLWHREAKRDSAASNWARVEARHLSGAHRAELGMAELDRSIGTVR